MQPVCVGTYRVFHLKPHRCRDWPSKRSGFKWNTLQHSIVTFYFKSCLQQKTPSWNKWNDCAIAGMYIVSLISNFIAITSRHLYARLVLPHDLTSRY